MATFLNCHTVDSNANPPLIRSLLPHYTFGNAVDIMLSDVVYDSRRLLCGWCVDDILNRRRAKSPFSYCLFRGSFQCWGRSCCIYVVTISQMIKPTHSTMILHPFTKPLSQAAPRIAASASFLQLRGGAAVKVIASNAPFDFDLAKTRLEGETILIYYCTFLFIVEDI